MVRYVSRDLLFAGSNEILDFRTPPYQRVIDDSIEEQLELKPSFLDELRVLVRFLPKVRLGEFRHVVLRFHHDTFLSDSLR